MANCKSERKIFEKLPFDVVDPDENEKPKVNFYIVNGFVCVGPKRYIQPVSYRTHGLDIYNFEAKPDDVYLVGYPRSGTTLHCEMVWLIGNDLDYEEAAKHFMAYRFPHLDLCLFRWKLVKEMSESKDASDEILDISRKYLDLNLEGLSERKGRRFLRSHLPLSLMPPHIFDVGAKVIYCARNPKDVLVSLFHASDFFQANRSSYDFKEWFNDFKDNLIWNTPYFEHIKEAWEKRNDGNVLFLFYEDTLKDKRQTIQKVADFLGKNLSKEQTDGLEDYLSFENFKNNKSVNNDQLIKMGLVQDNGQFIRRGKSGGWKDMFDEKLDEEFNELMEEKLKGTDLKFPTV